MENTDTAKWVEYTRWIYEEITQQELSIEDSESYVADYSSHCLEAKPKALHSMKEDENICPECLGSGCAIGDDGTVMATICVHCKGEGHI